MGYHVSDLYYLMKRDRAFWLEALEVLAQRQCYDRVCWSLGFYHHHPPAVAELLAIEKNLKKRLGSYFRSGLLSVDPPDSDWRLLDYHPLVNKRAHPLGAPRSGAPILNREFAQFYASFVSLLAEKPLPLETTDRLNLVYYLLLQDRVDQALHQFELVDPASAARKAPLQFDYMRAYLDFYTGSSSNYATAREVVSRYVSYPVIGWRLLFDDVRTQLRELDGEDASAAAPTSEEEHVDERRAVAHRRAIDQSPQLAATLEARNLLIDAANVPEVTVKYYPVDLELLFSREPFLTLKSGANPSADNDFSYVKPAAIETLPAKMQTVHPVAEAMAKHNMVIEVLAGPCKELLTYFASSMLRVTLVEAFGEIKIADARSGKPLSQVYVKVFAQKSGSHAFHKDGYTDIRGRFDYASLSSASGLKDITKFAILVASDSLGCLTREAKPPSGQRTDKI